MSGVLLIEKFRNRYNIVDYCVILFYNHNRGYYDDPGGHLMKKKTIKESAARELVEETCNLFRINPLYLTDYVNADGYYSFLAYIQGPKNRNGENVLDLNYYYNNRNIIFSNNSAPAHYKETSDVQRFYISDIINNGLFYRSNNHLECNDVNGIIRKISPRAINVLRHCFMYNYLTIIDNKVQVNLRPMTLGFYPFFESKSFLNGTSCYFI